jgi:uncharacterized protein with PIN domain
VFPRFHVLDVAGVSRVAQEPGVRGAFVLDGHLGTLARRLRLLGLDVLYSAEATDDDLAALAARDQRILLTRDRALLMRRLVSYGYFVRATDPDRQLIDVLQQFGPLPLHPFTRCLRCNGKLGDVPKSAVEARLPARTRVHYDRFQECSGCGRVYWQGAHWTRLVQSVERALGAADSVLSTDGRSNRPSEQLDGSPLRVSSSNTPGGRCSPRVERRGDRRLARLKRVRVTTRPKPLAADHYQRAGHYQEWDGRVAEAMPRCADSQRRAGSNHEREQQPQSARDDHPGDQGKGQDEDDGHDR